MVVDPVPDTIEVIQCKYEVEAYAFIFSWIQDKPNYDINLYSILRNLFVPTIPSTHVL